MKSQMTYATILVTLLLQYKVLCIWPFSLANRVLCGLLRSFLWDKHLEVGFLGHMIGICLNLKEKAKMFSMPFFHSWQRHVFRLLNILAGGGNVKLYKFRHSVGCAMVFTVRF